MESEIAIVAVVFGTPVAIVAIVCTYNLLKHWIDRRSGLQVNSNKGKTKKDAMSTEALSQRATDLQRRLNNLEEILGSEKQNGGAS